MKPKSLNTIVYYLMYFYDIISLSGELKVLLPQAERLLIYYGDRQSSYSRAAVIKNYRRIFSRVFNIKNLTQPELKFLLCDIAIKTNITINSAGFKDNQLLDFLINSYSVGIEAVDDIQKIFDINDNFISEVTKCA